MAEMMFWLSLAIMIVLSFVVSATKDGQSCTRVDVVDVQQQGVKSLNDIANDQVIIQMRNTSCVGRITGFVVSLSQEQSGSDYPSIQVWGPTKKSSPELFKNINYYELTEQDINKTGNYYFANVLLEEAFIFGQGSFIGYYQPPSPRYSIWSVNATGYNFYTFKGNNTRSLNLTRASDLLTVVKDSQPLIQIFFDIQCTILSTPANGTIVSCSSGKIGLGYEGDTCRFACHAGYELTDSDTRTCQSNGSWSGSDDVCRRAAVGGSNKNTEQVAIIIGAVLGSLLIIFTLIIMICGITLIRKRKKNKLYNTATNGTDMQQVYVAYTDVDEPENLQKKSVWHVNLSVSVQNDYSEPIFDPVSSPTRAALEGGYCYPQDAIMPDATPSPYSISLTNTEHSYVNYVKPPENLSLLFNQIKQTNVKDILRSSIHAIKELGYGEFGLVSLATWTDDDITQEVAVKTLNDQASETDRIRFFQEAAIMGQFLHENVIRLYGMIKEDPAMIVLEYAMKGDLRQYLIKLQPNIVEGEKVPDTVPSLLLKFSRQIAAGMEYLSNKSFIHRDLATRNILLTEQEMCKIADFGMSRDLEDDSFYIVSGGKIPVKWTAPEALEYKEYSTLSDVWSFGCVLYEIWSLGHKPFEDIPVKNFLTKINSGYRLAPPPGCPKKFYKLMIRCWHPDPKHRPAFILITKYLGKSDDDLLNINEEVIESNGEAALTLGNALSHSSKLYHELQTVYT